MSPVSKYRMKSMYYTEFYNQPTYNTLFFTLSDVRFDLAPRSNSPAMGSMDVTEVETAQSNKEI